MDSSASRMKYDHRAALVWEEIWKAPTPLTIGEIASRVGLTRSPYLRQIVNDLLAHGYLAKGLDTGERGHAVIIYWATEAPQWIAPEEDSLT